MYGFGIFLFIAPALLLAFWAQSNVRSSYARAAQVPTGISGAQTAQRMLADAGVEGVGIEEVHGHLNDHYDSRQRILRLSSDVFHGRSLAAVGIAAHEAGHAIQHSHSYLPLVIRNAAVPAASFGSNASFLLMVMGFVCHFPMLILFGIGLFACVVFFQIVNLPVEWDASARAKKELVGLGIVDEQEMPYVNKVLNAAAMTYVAATLQSILTLLYYLFRFFGGRR